ncbi:MAG TPA: YkgJ family cysteine cluster protein [Methanocella sp.]|jgi:Fe-S-cluster containining protein
MPDFGEDYIDGPGFACGCCGLCCRRDPYYAVSLLDIRNISMGLGLGATGFFDRFCAVVDTPGGFRYSVILAPDGCPFLKHKMCSIHLVKPIGCWVFPESALVPVRILKKSVTAIPTCAILTLPDDDRPLKADLELLAARDVHFEHTKKYFMEHDTFEEKSWQKATERLVEALQDADELARRSRELRAKAEEQFLH